MVLATRALSGKVADSSTGMDESNPVLSGPGTDSAPGSTPFKFKQVNVQRQAWGSLGKRDFFFACVGHRDTVLKGLG